MNQERHDRFKDEYAWDKPKPNSSFREMLELLGKMTIGNGRHTEATEQHRKVK